MIPVIIPDGGQDLIRDRIALVLMNEFNNQAINFYNTACEHVEFWAERIVPVDKSEIKKGDVIMLNSWKGEYNNKDVNYEDGVYKFAIGIVTGSPTIGGIPGDTLAGKRLTKLIGIIRYILSDAIYETLLFPRPFILNTQVTGFNINRFDEIDALTTAEGQIIFTVRAGEANTDITALKLTGAYTQVKIGITDKGYQYVFEEGGDPIPDDPRFVYIVNKETKEVLYMLPGGSRFEVEVLQEIIDTITGNETTIIDPITNG
jgi:hypothetical protein